MPIVLLKCPSCGGEIQLDDSKDYGFCMHCGQKIMTFENVKQTIRYDNSHLVENWLALGESALKSNDVKRVEKYADKAIEADSKNSFAWLLKGCSSLLSGRYSEAGHSWKRSFEAVEDKETAIRYSELVIDCIIQILPALLSLEPEEMDQFKKAEDSVDLIICPKFKLNPAQLGDRTCSVLYEKCELYAETEEYQLYVAYYISMLLGNSISDISCTGMMKRATEAVSIMKQMVANCKTPAAKEARPIIELFLDFSYHLNEIFTRHFSNISEGADGSLQEYWYCHFEERYLLQDQLFDSMFVYIENVDKLFGGGARRRALSEFESFAVRIKTMQ